MVEMKKYYKIGEVCKIVNIEPHHLRYWEKELRLIKSERSLKNQRLYTYDAIQKIKKIKLLLDQGYKLDIIKKKLNTNSEQNLYKLLVELKDDLQRVKKLLQC